VGHFDGEARDLNLLPDFIFLLYRMAQSKFSEQHDVVGMTVACRTPSAFAIFVFSVRKHLDLSLLKILHNQAASLQ
jgi:hypothetical protein